MHFPLPLIVQQALHFHSKQVMQHCIKQPENTRTKQAIEDKSSKFITKASFKTCCCQF